MLGVQQAGGFGTLRKWIFDSLRLIQNDVAETVFAQALDVAQHGAVSGQDDVVILERCGIFVAGVAHVFEKTEIRREIGRLALPVGEQTLGDDQQRSGSGPGLLPLRLEKSQHLDRFSQAHIVGQDTAKAIFFQEVQPIEARLSGMDEVRR